MTNTQITPTYQTFTGLGDADSAPGNCMVASIATVTNIPIEDIPHFVQDYCTINKYDGAGELNAMGWLGVLELVKLWLVRSGFATADITAPMDSVPFGSPVYPLLALVMSHEENLPHIIVTDQRWVQIWNPNPTDAVAYGPGDVIVAMSVTATS